MEAGVRSLPKMAKICLHQKRKLVTFNLTTGIETFPNIKETKGPSKPVEIV